MRLVPAIVVVIVCAAATCAAQEYVCPSMVGTGAIVQAEIWIDETLKAKAVRKSEGASSIEKQSFWPQEARYLEIACIYEGGQIFERLLPTSVRLCEFWSQRGESPSLELVCTDDPQGAGRVPSWWLSPTSSVKHF